MKNRFLMLLAVLLTGGMLVACGPGDQTADDTTGGVVDEPLATDPAGGDFGATTTDPLDGGLGDDVAVDGGTDLDVTTDAEIDTPDMTADADTGAEGEVAGGGAAAPAEGETVTVVFEAAEDGVTVSDVQGAETGEVAAADQSNPDLNLTVGNTYEFQYDGEGDLVFYGADDQPIFSTAGADSELATDAEVDAQMQDGMISFTVTDALAAELSRYTAGPNDDGGNVNVN